MSKRWIVALALIATAPTIAAAQFTTFIAPPNPVKDSIQAAVVAEQKATTDSVTRAQITDMKTWVDSAAGIVAIPRTDTVVAVNPVAGTTTTTVTTGLVAPATASVLPLLLVIGGLAMLIGAALVGPPRRPQPIRIERK